MPRRSRARGSFLFSYGSNNPKQLSERLEYSVRGAQGAYADGWQRVFRGYSRNWGGGVASLLRKSGSTTYGYVAPVTAEDLDILDRYEGVRSGNYKRQQITVTTADGEEIRAVAYISRSREFNEPTKAYLRATAKTIGQFWSGSGGPVKVSDIPIRNPSRDGKYRAVLKRYGRSGFGVPAKAPNVGSFPLYPIGRAQYALVLIAAPSYDKKKTQRAQIAKRALAAHPSLKSFWAARKRTINNRLSGGSRRMAANPRRYGRAPARSRAEAAMWRDGFYDFDYDKKGTVPGLGPVLAYTAYDLDGVEHRVNVGQLLGKVALEVRAISSDIFFNR